MSEPERKTAVHNAGAFLSDGRGPIGIPMRTLTDEYHDEPTEPEDAERIPDPEPPGLIRRVLDRLSRRSHP
ncbi:MAG: hypothetical protein ACHQZR_00440 [Candidatus Limnocylindrales bacterium]